MTRTGAKIRADGRCPGTATPGWHDAFARTAEHPEGSAWCVHCGRAFTLSRRGTFPAHVATPRNPS